MGKRGQAAVGAQPLAPCLPCSLCTYTCSQDVPQLRHLKQNLTLQATLQAAVRSRGASAAQQFRALPLTLTCSSHSCAPAASCSAVPLRPPRSLVFQLRAHRGSRSHACTAYVVPLSIRRCHQSLSSEPVPCCSHSASQAGQQIPDAHAAVAAKVPGLPPAQRSIRGDKDTP